MSQVEPQQEHTESSSSYSSFHLHRNKKPCKSQPEAVLDNRWRYFAFLTSSPKVNLLLLLHIIVAGLINRRCFFRTRSSFTVHEQFLRKRRKGGANLLMYFFFQERIDPKSSTCSTAEDKDNESSSIIVGMLNFRTDFESVGRNFDCSLAMLSIIHL